ncbi:hypothetical protein WS67_08815 [Burkholderia singularis]|uniref:Uncharacterized protein n=1 Tax=Burkholderia singularis TaxID=1503053 RepID=A0A103E5L4_9BURK|nr:hypothetical protein WS67_08815 [Burkholderia singularis]
MVRLVAQSERLLCIAMSQPAAMPRERANRRTGGTFGVRTAWRWGYAEGTWRRAGRQRGISRKPAREPATTGNAVPPLAGRFGQPMGGAQS